MGFRTVHLAQTPDEAGTGFALVINDQPIYVKGVNWIPDDVFPHRARYAQQLEQAVQAGVNLVRVWGGGIYEDNAFYDECDDTVGMDAASSKVGISIPSFLEAEMTYRLWASSSDTLRKPKGAGKLAPHTQCNLWLC